MVGGSLIVNFDPPPEKIHHDKNRKVKQKLPTHTLTAAEKMLNKKNDIKIETPTFSRREKASENAPGDPVTGVSLSFLASLFYGIEGTFAFNDGRILKFSPSCPSPVCYFYYSVLAPALQPKLLTKLCHRVFQWGVLLRVFVGHGKMVKQNKTHQS